MSSTELADNLRTTQAEKKLSREGIKGKDKANKAHRQVGTKACQSIKDLGGTMPEELLAPKTSTKTLEKQHKKQASSREISNENLPVGWRQCKIEEIANIYVGHDLKEESYSKTKTEKHTYPVYSNSVDNYGLYGYYDFEEYISNCLTVVARGALGTAFSRDKGFGAIGRLLVLSPKGKAFNARYLSEYINTRLRIYNESSGVPQLPGASFAKYKVVLPPLHIQEEICETLQKWDTAIEKTEALIDAKEIQFGWLRSNIIKNAQNTKAQKFGDFLKESKIPDIINDPQKRLTVRLHLNGVDVREYRGNEKEGATKYFIRKSGQLIYGKQNIFRGSIGIIPTELDSYSSSQDIPAFDIAKSIDADWLYWHMSRPHFYKRLEHFAAGSGSKRLHSKELFKMRIAVPPLPEQQAIANKLNTARQEITLLKKLADEYRTQKRGLMQKLLSGKWRIKTKENIQ